MKKVYEDGAPTMNIGSGGIAGAPPDSPPVSPRHQPKKNRSVPNPIIADMLRRKAPNQLAEVSKDLANNAYAGSKEHSDVWSNMVGGLPNPPKVAKKSWERTDRLKAHIARKWGKKGVKAAEKHADDYFNDRLDEETFAGAVVFEVSSHTFHNAKMEKRKGKHWRTYLDECDELSEIREYANKNPKRPIVLQNRNTNEMVYVRYGKAK